MVGWRGHGAVRRLLMGSVSRGVVRGSKRAVLVVRRSRRVRTIVVGFDGSPAAKRALAFVARLVPPRDGRVTLVTALELMPVPSRRVVPAPRWLRVKSDARIRSARERPCEISTARRLSSRAADGARGAASFMANPCGSPRRRGRDSRPTARGRGERAPAASDTCCWAASPKVPLTAARSPFWSRVDGGQGTELRHPS